MLLSYQIVIGRSPEKSQQGALEPFGEALVAMNVCGREQGKGLALNEGKAEACRERGRTKDV